MPQGARGGSATVFPEFHRIVDAEPASITEGSEAGSLEAKENACSTSGVNVHKEFINVGVILGLGGPLFPAPIRPGSADRSHAAGRLYAA